MKIKALAPWFGAKRKLAPQIIEIIGRHRVYWEPFCGSMAVLLVKPRCEMETVNDLHGDLINLAKVIQDEELGLALYKQLYRTLYSEALFKESKARWMAYDVVDEAYSMNIRRAYDYFVASWMGINGVSGSKRCDYQFALRWCVGGGQGAKRWQSVVSSIPAWHNRLKNVVIAQRDAFEFIENIKDEDGSVIYCDPPYVKLGVKYLHSFKDDDHGRLSELLSRFKKALVLVSYYDHPKLEELYKGFTKINFGVKVSNLSNACIVGPATKPRKKQTEVLFMNKPIALAGKLF